MTTIFHLQMKIEYKNSHKKCIQVWKIEKSANKYKGLNRFLAQSITIELRQYKLTLALEIPAKKL